MATNINLSDYITQETDVIDSTAVANVATRIRAVMKERWSDLDTSPSSVFGNLILSPLAKTIALYEQASSCILNDINLANALNGETCDCNFTENFIKGLGINNLVPNTYGLLNIEIPKNEYTENWFNGTDEILELDLGTTFAFKNQYIFHFFANKKGPIKIILHENLDRGPGDVINNDLDNENYYIAYCSDFDLDAQGLGGTPKKASVLIPIYGPPDAIVQAGDTATCDLPDDILNNWINKDSLNAYIDINPYETPNSIIQLAKLAQQIYPSANFSTKGGIVSYFKQKFPLINCISPTTQLDEECTTDTENPKLAIFCKSGSNYQVQHSVWIKYDDHNYPVFSLPFTALNILNVETLKDSSDPITEFQLVSTASTEETIGQGNKYRNNRLFIPTILPIMSGKYFKLTYTFDLGFELVSNFINNEYCKPFLATEIKKFLNYKIENLTIKYKKKAGYYIDRTLIKNDLMDLFNNVCYPVNFDNLKAYITDILLLNGAYTVDDIMWTETLSYALPYSNNTKITINPGNNNDIIISSEDKTITFQDDDLPWKEGPKNIGYYLDYDAINLVEESTI